MKHRIILMVAVVVVNSAIVKNILYKQNNNKSNKRLMISCRLVKCFEKYLKTIAMTCRYWYLWNACSCVVGVLVLVFSFYTMLYIVPMYVNAFYRLEIDLKSP